MTEYENDFPRKKFAYGDAFIEEPLGSATMINLDGQWEHDFVDDPTPAGQEEDGNEEAGINNFIDSWRDRY